MATRIICRALDCIFNENKTCVSEKMVYDPEDGCLTYETLVDLVDLEEDEDDWEDDELLDDDEELDWDDDDDDDDLLLDDDFDEEDL